MKKSTVASVSPSRYVSPEDRKSGSFDDYEIREALRTLTTAAKIRKNPRLMRLCRQEAQRQIEAAKSQKKNL